MITLHVTTEEEMAAIGPATLSFNEYQAKTRLTAHWNKERRAENGWEGEADLLPPIAYCALAMCGEAGELAEKVKKVYRDKSGVFGDQARHDVALELGDNLWYLAALADQLGYTLEDIAKMNVDKLERRKREKHLSGSGDNR